MQKNCAYTHVLYSKKNSIFVDVDIFCKQLEIRLSKKQLLKNLREMILQHTHNEHIVKNVNVNKKSMEKRGKILVADDNEDVLFALDLLLEPYVEKVKVTKNPERVEHFMNEFQPDVILLDMNFHRDAIGGQEGFELLGKILKWDPQAVVIFITAYSDTEKAVRAIKAGATDFISKPWEQEKLLATVMSGIKLRQSCREVDSLKEQITALGSADTVEEIFCTVDKLGTTDANVLLLGENGTGKDVVARLLHRNSKRCGKPFVHIDLGSVPEQLFESELFGYEKGAFTDARKPKAGRFEVANGGTLFLDEIGNLSPAAQAKLLSVLEQRRICRLGGTQSIPIDVRLICATNADIASMVESGSFRQDLYYRINTVEMNLPPLRQRGNDIILLAEHFLQKYSGKYGKRVPKITREARQKLLRYEWPGNVRELQHVMERAVILGNGLSLLPDDLPLKPARTTGSRAGNSATMNLQQLEQEAIERAMLQSGGNMNKAAEMLGITRYALYRKLNKLNTQEQ